MSLIGSELFFINYYKNLIDIFSVSFFDVWHDYNNLNFLHYFYEIFDRVKEVLGATHKLALVCKNLQQIGINIIKHRAALGEDLVMETAH